MRIKSEFAKRLGGVGFKEPKCSYFVVTEGDSEQIYFEAVKRFLASKNNLPLVNIKIVEKEGNEKGYSNPKKIFNLVTKNLPIWKRNKRIEWQSDGSVICYVDGIDHIVIVVDRDKHSFKEEQYNEVMQGCVDNNLGLYVSNPCFEFWLLLHFGEVENIDEQKLLENKKIGKRTFVEVELRRLMPYHKNRYDADKLVKCWKFAVKNEKNFSESLKELKDNVGSNVGNLVEEIMEV